MGHREGVKTLFRVAEHAFYEGVQYFSAYAFSTENRFRPQDEVDSLIDLIRKNFAESFSQFISKGIKVVAIGDMSFFPKDVVNIISEVQEKSKNGTKGTFIVALNYGGRSEILQAVNLLRSNDKVITEEDFENALYTKGIPAPDVLIRTGGEKRLSNFMLYQLAYTELFFSETLWPDFTTQEMDDIFKQYVMRNRRYGKV